MHEQHNTIVAIFGGKPSEDVEFKGNYFFSWNIRVNWRIICLFAGMAGNQVLEWADLDTEIKIAGLKDVRVFVSYFKKPLLIGQ